MSSSDKAAILCAGIAVQDIVMRVERFPLPGEKVAASEFIVTGGGCAANAAVGIARLGGRVRFAGPLGGPPGAEPVSDRIIADLEHEGVDYSGVERVSGGSASVSLILLDASGEKSIATRRGSRLTECAPRDPDTLVADVAAVLIDNRFPAFVTPVVKAARKRGIPVVIDGDQATHEDDALLALGTHMIFSSECLIGTTGGSDLKHGLTRMRQRLTGFLAVTDGANGVHWFADGVLHHMPAFAVTAIDTLGAGDAFHGAFTLALVEGRTEIEALRFASAAAALKCTRFGGAAGSPKRAEVDALLRR
ncbi:MAG TPA: PfkB family carbohydrate kinase [Pseudolabrys sp.]|nr:PfkB family carbohydrate kinase [Pseudolabrys sp.]